MNRIALALAGTFVLAALSFAQAPQKPPTIDVVGLAEIQVVPDEVVFSLDVTKRDKDMNIAKKQVDAVLAKIIDLTKRFGIAPEHVKTDHISVDMRYQTVRDANKRIFDEDGDETGTREFLGYDVATTVVVRLKDIARFQEFFAEVMKTGLTEVDSVRFESSEMIKQRQLAREMAMKAAHEKAAAMAGAVNQTIGKAIYISEGSGPEQRYGSPNSNAVNISTGPTVVTQPVATFSPGAIRISSQVSVTFLLN